MTFEALSQEASQNGLDNSLVHSSSSQTSELPYILSLFCGPGGLDWGFMQEGFQVALALDISSAAIKTHKRNFKSGEAKQTDLVQLGAQGVVEELLLCIPEKTKIGVIGGPPCQGFSRANRNPIPNDPRNLLPRLYIQIINALKEKFSVEFVVFENVLGIKDEVHIKTYKSLIRNVKKAGFKVNEFELCSADFGVAQNRKRIVLAAMRKEANYTKVLPLKKETKLNVKDVIGSLVEPAFFTRNLKIEDIPLHPNHWTMQPKSSRFKIAPELWKKSRSFKILQWNELSPTIAFGHREIHIHPNCKRRLSIYEAMLLQGFPKDFVLLGNLSEQVEQVSNAVPPPLARSLAAAVKESIRNN